MKIHLIKTKKNPLATANGFFYYFTFLDDSLSFSLVLITMVS